MCFQIFHAAPRSYFMLEFSRCFFLLCYHCHQKLRPLLITLAQIPYLLTATDFITAVTPAGSDWSGTLREPATIEENTLRARVGARHCLFPLSCLVLCQWKWKWKQTHRLGKSALTHMSGVHTVDKVMDFPQRERVMWKSCVTPIVTQEYFHWHSCDNLVKITELTR